MKLTKNQNGFSLIEVLIAIVLLSFLIIGVISVTEDSTTTKERVTSEDKDALQIETAMAKLRWDLNHIYTPLFYSVPMQFADDEDELKAALQARFQENKNFEFLEYNGQPVPEFKNEDKFSFEFFTLSNRRKYQDSKESNFAWVKYTVEEVEGSDGKPTKAFVRYFKATDPYGNERIDTNIIRSQILLEKVESVVFKFWDDKNREFMESLDLVQNGKNLVRGVKVEIKWKNIDDFEMQTFRIFRTLFPKFDPEDPYKILLAKEQNQNGGSGANGNGSENENDGDANE